MGDMTTLTSSVAPYDDYSLPPCDDFYNDTLLSANDTRSTRNRMGFIAVVMSSCYVIICVVGLLGNGLVIYVVVRFAKMKTVTNMYILNLAISDVLFLLSLPFLTTTTFLQYWVFDFAMCKIYLVLFSINLFTSVFMLTVMSADRYLAVCHPIRSLKYRTPNVALIICLCIWSVSFLVMLPIILYSTTVANPKYKGKHTCTISWPEGQPIPADKAFIWYTFILGFAIPVSMISVFYVFVVLRLRRVGPAKKSKEKKRSHRRVTRMVLTVIAVYVICWLPYWIFQVDITFNADPTSPLQYWKVNLFSSLTVLTFTNSMLNPFLYAFLSDNFRKSFLKAFKCASPADINKSLCGENSLFPRSSQSCAKSAVTATTVDDRMELSTFETNQNSTSHVVCELNNQSCQDEQGLLKPVAL
ncbi:somatostatin receptor type 2-like [Gigantopelta aegis]|uniref:somatostatin receptor type 2-like n=1 Tax=Gigantopelta aegis TaxID=1735272 RepID=UPI001B88B8B5|nr:somatostatin receptor type 2-like [Gigantopelta aegis]